MSRKSLRALALAALVVPPAAAQTPSPAASPGPPAPPAPAVATLSGVVFDSLLTGDLLPNATLWIEGTPRETKTNLNGSFRFDSLQPGTYQLTFTHPVFDASGISAPRWRLELPAGGLQGVVLATPSAESRYGKACPSRDPGTGFLIGVVRDAAADTGLVGAAVHAMWSEVSVSRTTGVTTNRRSTRAETGPGGGYVLCNVPVNRQVTAWAARGKSATGLVTVDLGGRPLAARQFTIGLRAAAGGDSATTPARLMGTVKTIDGEPIADARVFVRGSRSLGRSTLSGAFLLDSLPAGTQVVEVVALGYVPGRQSVDLRPGRSARTELVLAKSVQTLPALEVIGKLGSGNDVSTFLQRAQRSQGYFITAEEIERRGAITFEDIMRTVPGISVLPVGQGYRVFSSRGVVNFQGDCAMTYFIDGIHFPMDRLSEEPFPVAPMEILAVEVYAGAAQVPVELQRMQNTCGAIAIWTKRGGGGPRTR